MKKIFILLDCIFLNNFESEFKEVFLKHNLNEHFEIFILNLDVRSDKLCSFNQIKNVNIIEFSGENLFNYIYENTVDASYFIMPHLISNFPFMALKVCLTSDKIYLNKNYISRGLERVLSCIKNDSTREDIRKEIEKSPIFFDSFFGTTLYNSDLMYGNKDFYGSLCETFKEINKPDVIMLDSHMKFDLALNLTLLKNKYSINSV